MASVSVLYPRGFLAYHRSVSVAGWYGPPSGFTCLSFGELTVWFDSERTPAVARSELGSVLVVGTAAFVPPGSDRAEATADLQSVAETLHAALVKSQEHFLDALDYLGGRFAIIVEVDGLWALHK